MIETATFVLLLLAGVMAVPVLFLIIQIGAALTGVRRPALVASSPCPSIAVVMPAHNEEAIIGQPISSVLSQLPPGGRLLVVADNCTDGTAEVALRMGAEVTVRRDKGRIGKGYALDHGVRVVSANPPQVAVFIDADCEVAPGSLETLAKFSARTGRPAQARYSMLAAPSAGPVDKVSQLAWITKTLVRPLGSARLGMPCQLMGTGMALPWEMIGAIDFATGHIAEDQKFGAELALIGKAPLFCPQAEVLSRLPQGEAGKHSQRTRWEHGHLAIIGEFLLPLSGYALSRRSFHLLAFALDMCVPPLSLIALSLVLLEGATLSWWLMTGSLSPVVAASTLLFCFAASIVAAWWRFGQGAISLRELTAVPVYCLQRIPSLIRFFINRQTRWVRTER